MILNKEQREREVEAASSGSLSEYLEAWKA
jgi:hypothetical protein